MAGVAPTRVPPGGSARHQDSQAMGGREGFASLGVCVRVRGPPAVVVRPVRAASGPTARGYSVPPRTGDDGNRLRLLPLCRARGRVVVPPGPGGSGLLPLVQSRRARRGGGSWSLGGSWGRGLATAAQRVRVRAVVVVAHVEREGGRKVEVVSAKKGANFAGAQQEVSHKTRTIG
jgi:hypothetical protein